MFVSLIFIAIAIASSPIIDNFFILKGNQLSILSLFIAFLIKLFSNFDSNHNKRFFVYDIYFKLSLTILLLLVFLIGIHSIYWEQNTYKLIAYFISALIIVNIISKSDLILLIKQLRIFYVFLSFLSLVGFIYAYYGGHSFFSITNLDSRINNFYLATFSNSFENYSHSIIIRPSGIYDEPGAFVFFICLSCVLMQSQNLGKNYRWVLMLFGFITISLSFFIFFICFLLDEFIRTPQKKYFIRYLIIGFIGIAILYFFIPSISLILDRLAERLHFENGRFVGDNRTILAVNSFNYLSKNVFLWGLNADCMLGHSICNAFSFLNYGENPLSPLVHYGFLISFPYYLILALFIWASINERRFIYFGVFLLLLQRPYVMQYSYSILILLVLFSIFKFRKYPL
jgi:hypothetical protein